MLRCNSNDFAAMKIDLTLKYRFWMLALFPVTLGLGTIALWVRSLNWPSEVDAAGLTLRRRCKVPWTSVKTVGVYRDYIDGCICRMEIHHRRGTSRIPIGVLRDGERVADAILAMFKETLRARPADNLDHPHSIPDGRDGLRQINPSHAQSGIADLNVAIAPGPILSKI